MKTFADVKRRLRAGVVLECVENTYRPELNGSKRRIELVQTNAIAYQHPNAAGEFQPTIPRRELFWSYFPASAKDVLIKDADTFSWLILPGHTVTLRFIGGENDAVSA